MSRKMKLGRQRAAESLEMTNEESVIQAAVPPIVRPEIFSVG
jgi:hypothetical protein